MTVKDVLQEVINNIQPKLVIYTVVTLGTGYRCYTKNTWHLNKNAVVTINNKQYRVTDHKLNEYVELVENSGAAQAITVGTYDIKSPTFKYGKLKAVNEELARLQPIDFMPLIWMFMLQPRQGFSNKDSAFESTGSVRLFFMNTSRNSEYDTEQHYKECIDPMLNVVNGFLEQLEKHKRVRNEYVNQAVDHARFTSGGSGITATNEKDVLGRDMSGIELIVTIPIVKDRFCQEKVEPTIEGPDFNEDWNVDFNAD